MPRAVLHFKENAYDERRHNTQSPTTHSSPHVNLGNTRASVSIEHSVAAPGCVVVAVLHLLDVKYPTVLSLQCGGVRDGPAGFICFDLSGVLLSLYLCCGVSIGSCADDSLLVLILEVVHEKAPVVTCLHLFVFGT